MSGLRIVFNKVVFTPEAIYDYEFVIAKRIIPKKEIKEELEEYIDWINNDGKYFRENYIRAQYYDEAINQMLMMFLYRDKLCGVMQNWRLAGICFARDWNEDAEYSGRIRVWLESPVDFTEIPYEDWVVDLREWKQRIKELENSDE